MELRKEPYKKVFPILGNKGFCLVDGEMERTIQKVFPILVKQIKNFVLWVEKWN